VTLAAYSRATQALRTTRSIGAWTSRCRMNNSGALIKTSPPLKRQTTPAHDLQPAHSVVALDFLALT